MENPKWLEMERKLAGRFARIGLGRKETCKSGYPTKPKSRCKTARNYVKM